MRKPIINLITPKHTGTNSVATLLCQSPDVCNSWGSLNWALWQGHHHLDQHTELAQVFHHHVGWHPTTFNSREACPWYREFVHQAFLPWVMKGGHGPIITTMRDPLGSIVTSRRRRPNQPTDWIVDSFTDIKIMHYELGIRPFCIDKHGPEDILGLFRRCDIRPPAKALLPRVETTSSKLRPELGKAYRAGDIGFLEKHMPKDIEWLRSQEDLLRPWMEDELGYRELSWWSWN